METDQALSLLDKWLEPQKLKDIQQLVFQRSWEGQTYQEMAEATGYDPDYIKDVGSQLWQLLSEALGERVTKRNLQSVFRLYAKVQQQPPAPVEPPPFMLKRRDRPLQTPQGENTNLTSLPNPKSAPQPNQHLGFPIPLTPLIGRATELEQLVGLIRRNRLVTLTGCGGSGKTRLALACIQQVRLDFSQGVCFVALASLKDPKLFLPTLAIALAIPETNLKSELASRHLFLVLDNFEQLLEAAPQLADLLLSAPQLRVLVTSRAPLHLRGEQEFPVLPLPFPTPQQAKHPEHLVDVPSVALLLERVQGVRPSFTLTSENAPVIAQICTRLDGLPLALELAAARFKILSPQALLQRLNQRLKLLVGGSSDLPERHQTLRATLDWSYDLLTPAQQELFAQLSIFVGGWNLDAATEVCQYDVLEDCATLLDMGLLTPCAGVGEEPRFTMLEIVREYATERLMAMGNYSLWQLRHAQYFLTLVEVAEPGMKGTQQGHWLAKLEENLDNLRAALQTGLEQQPLIALRLGGALKDFWRVRGYLREGLNWLTQIIESLALADPRISALLKAKVLRSAGTLAFEQSDFTRARTYHEASLSIAREANDREGIASVLNSLGLTALDQGDYASANTYLREGLTLAQEVSNTYSVAVSLVNLGTLMQKQGDLSQAHYFFKQSLVLRRQLGDIRGVASALMGLGNVVLYQENYQLARTYYQESLAIQRQLNHGAYIAALLSNLGHIERNQNNLKLALVYLEEALQLAYELNILWCLVSIIEEIYTTCIDYLIHTQVIAQLMSAIAALRTRLNLRRSPSDLSDNEALLHKARVALGDDTFEQNWAEGEQLSLENTFQIALACCQYPAT